MLDVMSRDIRRFVLECSIVTSAQIVDTMKLMYECEADNPGTETGMLDEAESICPAKPSVRNCSISREDTYSGVSFSMPHR